MALLSACGAAVLYRSKAFLLSGALDADFFAYVDDLDLALRTHFIGYCGTYVPNAVAHLPAVLATHCRVSDSLVRVRGEEDQEDSETESFARIVKARLLLRMKKTEDARVEADRALTLAVNDRQSDNEVAAAVILAEIKAMHGLLQQALVDLKELNNRTSHKNVIQNLEVRLVTARLMLKYGTAQQRTEAKGRLQDILSEAQGSSHYVFLATEAQASLKGRVH